MHLREFRAGGIIKSTVLPAQALRGFRWFSPSSTPFCGSFQGWTATRGRRAARVSVEATRRRGLPRGVGFGSRAGGSGSLRSPFVDVDSPSLPMVDALSGARLGARHGGGATAQRRGAASGSAAACAAPQRLGGARAVRSGWAGGAPRARRLTSGQYFFALRRGAIPAVVPGLSALKGYNMTRAKLSVGLELACQTLRLQLFA